jgi:hypothetical protein
MDSWTEDEFAEIDFNDERLSDRVNTASKNPKSMILAVQDTTYLNYSYQPKTPGLGEISNFKDNSDCRCMTNLLDEFSKS